MIKTQSFIFFNKKKNVNEYNQIYKKNDFSKNYPANRIRLNIIKKLLLKYKPRKICDAGCGSGSPLIEIKKMGFNIHGYDRSKNMVDAARLKLIKNGFSEKLVNLDNFEKPRHIKNNSQDCILGLGTFYYTNKFKQTLINQKKKLKKNGRLIFSLRNELFNISTLNDYTSEYLKKVYPISRFNSKTRKKFDTLINKAMIGSKRKFKNIDDNKVFSLSHNPLTIKLYLKNEIGLSCENILFYHFHALPPKLEEYDKMNFRKLSFKMENPSDWRGNLIASSFIVDAKKI